MGRTKETERPRYAVKVRAYYARHRAGDPGAQDLSLEGIAKGAGVSRTPMSAEALTCPIIGALLQERVVLLSGGAAAPEPEDSAPAPTAGGAAGTLGGAPSIEQMRERARAQMPPGLDLLDDRALTMRMRQCLTSAAKAMDGWNSRHGLSSPMDEVSLARHDLELLAWQLRAIADELGPLVEIREQRDAERQREQGTNPPPAGVSGGGQTTMGF